MYRPLIRPRRNRKNAVIRSLVQETRLHVSNLIYPQFIVEGKGVKIPIQSMPGLFRLSIDLLLHKAEEMSLLGINTLALFPVIDKKLKDPEGSYACDPNGLLVRAIKHIKAAFPHMCVIADIALDPYTSHGHDGILSKTGEVLNDETVAILEKMALIQAEVGVDIIAPSDMMDGRVHAIRQRLDKKGFFNVLILAYTAKYASCFYAPFREALDSKLQVGHKKSYQLNPANRKEALLEAHLDVLEGADILMVKPALAYLDIIAKISAASSLPIAAYQVSGEYSMIMAASQNGWLDEKLAWIESLLCIKRAGADMIFTYAALKIAALFKSGALD